MSALSVCEEETQLPGRSQGIACPSSSGHQGGARAAPWVSAPPRCQQRGHSAFALTLSLTLGMQVTEETCSPLLLLSTRCTHDVKPAGC